MSAEHIEPSEIERQTGLSESVRRMLGGVAIYVDELTSRLSGLPESARVNRGLQTKDQVANERWLQMLNSILDKYQIDEGVITREWVAGLHGYFAEHPERTKKSQTPEHRYMQAAAHWLYLEGDPARAVDAVAPEVAGVSQSWVAGLKSSIIKQIPKYYPGVTLQPTRQIDTLDLVEGVRLTDVIDNWRRQNLPVQDNMPAPSYKQPEKQPQPHGTYEFLANQAARYIGREPAGVYMEMFGLMPDRIVTEEMRCTAREALFSAIQQNDEDVRLPDEIRLDHLEKYWLGALIGKRPKLSPEGVRYQDATPLSYNQFRTAALLYAKKTQHQQTDSEIPRPHTTLAQIEDQLHSAFSKCIRTARFIKSNPST